MVDMRPKVSQDFLKTKHRPSTALNLYSKRIGSIALKCPSRARGGVAVYLPTYLPNLLGDLRWMRAHTHMYLRHGPNREPLDGSTRVVRTGQKWRD
jgi:hypothetical protein